MLTYTIDVGFEYRKAEFVFRGICTLNKDVGIITVDLWIVVWISRWNIMGYISNQYFSDLL